MSYITVKDSKGKVVLTYEVDEGISVNELCEMIDKGLEKLGTEVAV